MHSSIIERRRLLATMCAAFAVLSLLAISSSAVSAASSVNVFDVDTYIKTVTAGNSADFQWVVFDNGTTPLLVKINFTLSQSSDVSGQLAIGYFALDPGQSNAVDLKIATEKALPTTTILGHVTISITDMTDPSQVTTITKDASLKVNAAISTSAGQNKIFGIWDNFLPPPFDTNVGAFVVSVIGWALIALAIAFVVDPIIRAVAAKTTTTLDDILLKILRGPIFLLVITYGTVTSLEILNLDRDTVAQIEQIYAIAIVAIAAWIAYRVYDGIILYYAKKFASKTETELDDVLVPLMEKIGLIVIPIVAIMVILGMLGYDLTALLAGAGFLGIVVGLAAQSTLANFFAGMQLVADRPFKVGDLLRIDSGEICEVKHIGMRATELWNTDTNEMVIIPNNDIANKKIVNMVEPDRQLVVMVQVDVAYGTDTEKVMTILKQVALDHPNVLKDVEHQPVVRFADFGQSALTFKLFMTLDDLKHRYKVPSDVRAEINRRFAAEGIEIPFPQQVIHLVDDAKDKKSAKA
jgi:small-conductance mechanosensitive channel